MVMPDAALRIDEIESGPILIAESAPYRVAAVDCDGKGDANLLDCMSHVAQILLEFKLRRVHSDHHQSLIPVFVCPCPNVRQSAPPIDTGIRPELDQYDLTAQPGHGERSGVEPFNGPDERR